MNWTIASVIIVALISSASGYFIARRTTSGSIDTSDAATLWAESQAMRKELRDEVVSLRTELIELRKELTDLEKEKIIDHQKIQGLLNKIKKLEKHIKDLGGTI